MTLETVNRVVYIIDIGQGYYYITLMDGYKGVFTQLTNFITGTTVATQEEPVFGQRYIEALAVLERNQGSSDAFRMTIMNGKQRFYSVMLPKRIYNPQLEPVSEDLYNMALREKQDDAAYVLSYDPLDFSDLTPQPGDYIVNMFDYVVNGTDRVII